MTGEGTGASGTDPDDGPASDSPDQRSDGGVVADESPVVDQPFGLPRWVTAVVPIVLLAVLVAVFLLGSPLAGLEGGGEPLPDVAVTHVTLADERMTLHVVNSGPEVTIAQVLVDEAYWSWETADGDPTLSTMESTKVVVPYHWEPGWDVEVALVLSSGVTVHHTIVAAHGSPEPGSALGTLAVMGVFVGVVPVALGMLWFPYIQGMSKRRLHAVLAFSAGVLLFLAWDAGLEALELAEAVPGAFEGPAVAFLGAAGALLVVQSVGAWRRDREGDGGAFGLSRGLWVAYLVALGIGLHNLAEGLAIGSSFALGRVSLGAFLVVGFMVHNVTEGPAVVAPLAEGERPHWAHFVALGALAGAPVILGGWIGGLAFSPLLGTLFLAIGVGAIAQVLLELAGIVRDAGGRVGSATNLLALLVGLVVMYATDLLVTL
jgi:ZIP family zinc transporter